ncbi:MAG: hypothetical protein KF696_06950 [Planctomycetes bacterium]|nr:hypothetical protein [Planctomycetota bacterium]MCW8135293.1 hypothetical protein [Planctomycetota bacterium]
MSRNLQAGGKLVLRLAIVAALTLFSTAVSAQAIGSQAANITFSQSWGPIPSGFTQLNNYFTAPGYITMLELWAPG